MAEDSSSNAISGGLLVVLGVIVALGTLYFLSNEPAKSSGPNISIHADIPPVEAPKQ